MNIRFYAAFFSFFLLFHIGQCQGLLISQSSYIIGEELSFDLVIPAEDSSAYVYMQLIDPWDMEVVDFQVYLVGSRLMQGSIGLDKEKLRTGPYLLTALSQKGSLLGIQTLHVLEGRHTEVYQALLSGLSGQAMDEQMQADFSRFTELRLEHQASSHSFTSWEALLEALTEGEGGFYKLHFTDSKGEKNQFVLPSAAHLQRAEPLVKEAYWIRNSSDQAKDYSISWYGQELLSFSLEGKESLELALESFPVGELKLSDGKKEQIIRNTPSIEAWPNQDLRMAFGEELSVNIPALSNPLAANSNMLIHAVVSRQPIVQGEIGIYYTSQESSYQLAFAEAFVEGDVNRNKIKDFQGLVLMDSAAHYPLAVDKDYQLSLTAENIYQLSRGEGRIRLGKMDSKLQVQVRYPEMEALAKELNKTISDQMDGLIWTNHSYQNYYENTQFLVIEEVWDLDEIIVNANSIEDLDATFSLLPFSEHWINTDWICVGSVLNCDKHQALYGDLAKRPRNTIPLHIYLHWMDGQAEFNAAVQSAIQRAKNEIGAGSNKAMDRVARVMGTNGIYMEHPEDFIRNNPKSLMSVRQSYSWSPEPYLKNMAVVKFFNDDRFEGLHEDDVVNVEERQGQWRVYQENMSLTLKSSYARGSYFLHLTYLDLHSDLHSTISIPFEVR